MTTDKNRADSNQARWARFRFSVVGPLLASPPEGGELKGLLEILSKKQWRHPITEEPVFFSVSAIERWFYQAKNTEDPVRSEILIYSNYQAIAKSKFML